MVNIDKVIQYSNAHLGNFPDNLHETIQYNVGWLDGAVGGKFQQPISREEAYTRLKAYGIDIHTNNLAKAKYRFRRVT